MVRAFFSKIVLCRVELSLQGEEGRLTEPTVILWGGLRKQLPPPVLITLLFRNFLPVFMSIGVAILGPQFSGANIKLNFGFGSLVTMDGIDGGVGVWCFLVAAAVALLLLINISCCNSIILQRLVGCKLGLQDGGLRTTSAGGRNTPLMP